MDEEPEPLDLLWGVDAIAKVIGRTYRQTYHMIRTGHLPAKQVGGRWVVSRAELEAFFSVNGEFLVSSEKVRAEKP